MFVVALVVVVAVVVVGDVSAASKLSVLRSSVFHGYDRLVMPDTPVQVEFGVNILNLHLCPHKQVPINF